MWTWSRHRMVRFLRHVQGQSYNCGVRSLFAGQKDKIANFLCRFPPGVRYPFLHCRNFNVSLTTFLVSRRDLYVFAVCVCVLTALF